MPRRSLFRFSHKAPRPLSKNEQAPVHPRDEEEVSLPEEPEARYIPRQWAPNRLQTLYVTASDRNLYLAAMAQLDRSPPPLPLWADPAPTLPAVPQQAPIDPTPPSVQSPRRRFNLPLAGASKMVTSPGMPTQGLSVRDEFRSSPERRAAGGGPSEHALVAFSDESQLRFHNFPIDVLVAIDETLKEAWPRGQRSAHPNLAELSGRSGRSVDGREPATWVVVLKGNVWKHAGDSELETIRLVLALLSCLSVHGWSLVDRMQATGFSNDNHNLLFAHSEAVLKTPPTYFAVSIPLPDRIATISPPPKATPAIIAATRGAIEIQKAGKTARDVAGRGTGQNQSEVEWHAWKGDIRQEGWVHSGVYRFWLGGLRRWLGNGVKWRVVERLHPSLILALINSLSTQHFSLLTSLPLLPLVKGRDILIFASQPSSGLTYRDTWKSQPSVAGTDTERSESPVLVQPEDAVLGRGEVLPRELETTLAARDLAGQARLDAAGAMAAERRQATEIAAPMRSDTSRHRHASLDSYPASNLNAAGALRRQASDASGRSLVPGNVSSPRQRNLLVKKTSLRKNGPSGRTVSRSSSLQRRQNPGAFANGYNRSASLDESRPAGAVRPDQVHVTSRHGIGSDLTVADDEWSFVDLPRESGLGLSMYAPQAGRNVSHGPPAQVSTRYPAWNDIEAPNPPPLPPRPADLQHSAIATHGTPQASVRRNEADMPGGPPPPPRPNQRYSAAIATAGSSHNLVPAPVVTNIRSAAIAPPAQDHQAAGRARHSGIRPRPSFESERSVYVDAPEAGHPSKHIANQGLPPSAFSHSDNLLLPRPDSDTYDTSIPRELIITNPTPPPAMLVHPGIAHTLDLPLSQPTSPLRGRDAMVDVGSGLGSISVRGSVGYMPSLASQSVLGLTPAPSEGPILGAWNDRDRGGEPSIRSAGDGLSPISSSQAPASTSPDDRIQASPENKARKGKGRELLSGLFSSAPAPGPAGSEGGGSQASRGNGNGVGSARTKISVGP